VCFSVSMLQNIFCRFSCYSFLVLLHCDLIKYRILF
jgi:hypothetical protein